MSVGKGEKKESRRGERERKDIGELGGREGWRKKVGRRGVGEFEGGKREKEKEVKEVEGLRRKQ